MVNEKATVSTGSKVAGATGPKKTAVKKAVLAHGVGRRKKAVARVWLRRGAGRVEVNGLSADKYFDTTTDYQTAIMPFTAYPIGLNYDIQVNVRGGGKTGQADAVKLGIARAFLEQDTTIRPALKKYKLLTVDSRVKERKKYGQRGARAKFQFVKR